MRIAAPMSRYRLERPVRSIISYIVVFCTLSWFVQRRLGSPFDPHFADERTEGQLLEAAWWIVGGLLAAGLVRMLIERKHRQYEARIVSDLLAAAIYVATAFAVISIAFHLPIGGLLATSGVIAIVLGLALQSTLADVFSGIAVGLERPYKPGDLLWVEGGLEGRVVQITWRSTQISTRQHNIAIIPNSIIAKSRLENRSWPTAMRGDTVPVSLDANADPTRCLAALTAAVSACRLLLADPAPSVTCSGLYGDGTRYEVWYFVPSSEELSSARTEITTQIHRHLRHAGIPQAVTGLATTTPVPAPAIIELLAQSDVFGVLEPDERELLAEHFVRTSFERGDTLIREGDTPDALFLLASGTVDLSKARGEGAGLSLRLGPGESFGMIGLLMGIPYAVTATALTPLAAYRLDKEGIAASIRARPELAVGLEALARRAHESLLREVTANEHAPLKQPELFLARLRQFLSRLKI
jgi:small-conductance mechanosensitive channel/CRP-like cAMP-binding protein